MRYERVKARTRWMAQDMCPWATRVVLVDKGVYDCFLDRVNCAMLGASDEHD